MAFSALWTEHGFWCIQEGGVRAFLIEGREKAVLIDTTRERGLYEFCRTITDKPIMVVLTHSDPDHISSNCEFEEIYLNPADYAYYKTKADFLPQIHPIWEGDIIDLGNYIFEVFSIPGHTPGSIFLLERNRRFAIGGDSVQTGPIFMFGPGRDMNAFIASMEKLMPYICLLYTSSCLRLRNTGLKSYLLILSTRPFSSLCGAAEGMKLKKYCSPHPAARFWEKHTKR